MVARITTEKNIISSLVIVKKNHYKYTALKQRELDWVVTNKNLQWNEQKHYEIKKINKQYQLLSTIEVYNNNYSPSQSAQSKSSVNPLLYYFSLSATTY